MTPPNDDLDFGQTIRGFSEGQKVFGRYTLRHILGRGGMGIVWLAWDDKLERDIALKFMPEMVRLDASAVDELKRETRKSLSLTHTNIVRIFDYVDDGQSAAIAMEYIDGPTLSTLRVQEPGRVFEVEDLQGWATQICEALAYAHEEARVVHRDLKPANLMVTTAGRIKITDFGIARSICDSASRMSMAVGNSSGTLVYMSPQQMDGENPSPLDDIYSLGATFYELLTSRPPFSSGNIAAQVKEKIPPPMSERRAALEVVGQPIPAHWETTIAACLAKDPAERPQSMREVLQGLKDALPPVAPEPPIIGIPLPPEKPPKKSPAVSRSFVRTAVCLVLAVAGGGAAWFGWQWNETRKVAAQTAERIRQEEARDAEQAWRAEAREAEHLRKMRDGIRKINEEESARKAVLPKTITVPDDFPRVQAAIDAARSGDTVKIKPGTYKETLTMKDGVRLSGTDEKTCLIEAEEGAAAILTAIDCTSGSIQNLTFQGNDTVTRAIFSAGWSLSKKGDGVFVEKLDPNGPAARAGIQEGARVVSIGKREIGGNYELVPYILALGGRSRDVEIVTEFNGSTQTQVVTPFLTTAQGTWPDGLAILDSAITILDSTVERFRGAGIVVSGPEANATIQSTLSRSNGTQGISISGRAKAKIVYSDCEMNLTSGILVSGGGTHAEVADNRFTANSASAIFFDAGAEGVIYGNTIENNKVMGVAILGVGTKPTLKYNRFINNGGFGIAYGEGATPEIGGGNIFEGNAKGDISSDALRTN